MARLFGTDGVRGVANQNLTPEMAFGLGQAAGVYFKKIREQISEGGFRFAAENRAHILVGQDTRVSGDMLAAALMAGITSMGVDVWQLGVLPTPGVAFLCRRLTADAGVMISASHNPVEDNGIKFFDNRGFKLSDAAEDEIEAVYKKGITAEDRAIGVAVGRIFDQTAARKIYEDYLVGSVPVSFNGLRVVVDCGYGAAYDLAPKVLERLGAEVIALHDRNYGNRINVKCGSTHTGTLQKEVVAYGADAGIAHDGDADRVIAVDEGGHSVDGDQIITICGLDLLQEGKLKNNKVAVTVYSNLGLIQAFKKRGAEVVITANGDRYVLEALKEHDLVLGGEQSGHIIFFEKNSTGDGILTALQLLAAMVKSRKKLSELAAQMVQLPQVLENVRVSTKDGWDGNLRIKEAVQQAETELKGSGRIFVRASGTEPLIRVMAEGPCEDDLRRLVDTVVEVIRQEQGV